LRDDASEDFTLLRFVAGSFKENTLTIANATGHATLAKNLDVQGQAYFGDATDTVSANAATLDFDSGNMLEFDMQPSTATVAVTLSNMQSGGTYFAMLLQGSGLDDVTFSSSGDTILWTAGSQPGVIGFNNRWQIYKFVKKGTIVWGSLDWEGELTPG